ncbi:hypothetical protein HPB49_008472 [Dermacentor silvarum]|uniref:Uncharacterized protein n=1 Tax=Dermacentor silvarum TaxID=543639 RepID=A0ACB8CK05_DERSI|nr:hypothetical protein HPB49_008472 [Dermacentor silvarum]
MCVLSGLTNSAAEIEPKTAEEAALYTRSAFFTKAKPKRKCPATRLAGSQRRPWPSGTPLYARDKHATLAAGSPELRRGEAEGLPRAMATRSARSSTEREIRNAVAASRDHVHAASFRLRVPKAPPYTFSASDVFQPLSRHACGAGCDVVTAHDEQRHGIWGKSGGSEVSGRMPLAAALGRSRRVAAGERWEGKSTHTPTRSKEERDAWITPRAAAGWPGALGVAPPLRVCGRTGGSGNASRGGTIARRRGGERRSRRRAAGCCFSLVLAALRCSP